MRILGIDIGVSSLGWALVDTDEKRREKSESEIVASGVRIFPKPEDKKKQEPLAAARRRARSARRTLRRKAGRMRAIKQLFLKYLPLKEQDVFDYEESGTGTIYKEGGKIDVWKLRHEVLERKLEPKEFSRILTHIAKRRGYFSNSKEDFVEDKEDKNLENKKVLEENKKVLAAIEKNRKLLEGKDCQTIGQFLYLQSGKTEGKKENPMNAFRIRNKENDYSHCVAREMLKEEVKVVFQKQRGFGHRFPDDFEKQYLELAFYQRPIKSIAAMVGYCKFESEERRAPKNSYTAEHFMATSTIINTTVIDESEKDYKKREKSLLEVVCESKDSYNAFWDDIFSFLYEQKEVKYLTLRKNFGLPKTMKFKRVDYQGNVELKNKLPSYEKFIDEEKGFIDKEKGLSEQQVKSLWYEAEKKKSSDKKEIKEEKKTEKKFHRWLRTYMDVRDYLKRKKLPLSEDFKFKVIEKKYNKNPEDEKLLELKSYHTLKKALTGSQDGEMLFKYLLKHPDVYDKTAKILTEEKGIEESIKRLKEVLEGVLEKVVSEEKLAEVLKKLALILFSGYSHLSLKAQRKLLPLMRKGMRYNEAMKEVYGHHSADFKRKDKQGQEKKSYLPKLTTKQNHQLTNPVVKRAVTQFRKVVNAIIRRYGEFDCMHVEMARELKHGKKARIKIAGGQKEFRQEKEAIRHKFVDLFGREPQGKELLKLRLWNQQNSRSVYSNEAIDLQRLIDDDTYTQIDHILPYSRSFDNSLNNKVLVFSGENQEKKKMTPFEWKGGGDVNSPAWREFKQLASTFKNLRGAKVGKLLNIDLPRATGEEISEENTENMEKKDGFLARNLNDTRYMSRFIKKYTKENLKFSDSDVKEKVKVRSGSLTSHLRYLWKLENKDRATHIHHVVDAIVIAFSTQSEVQRFSRYAALIEGYAYKSKEEKKKIKELQTQVPFKQDYLDKVLSKVTPSFMPRRKVKGAAHEETLYSGETYETIKRSESGFKKEELKGSGRRYPVKVNKGRTLAKKATMPRMDLFRQVENGKYYSVPIYVGDFVKKRLPNHAVVAGSKPWLEMDDSYEFVCSFYKNDFMEIKFKKVKDFNYKSTVEVKEENIKKDEKESKKATKTVHSETIQGYYNGLDAATGSINIKDPHENIECRLGIQGAVEINKFEVDVLGNLNKVGLPQQRVGSIPQVREIKKAKEEDRKPQN